MRFCNMQTRSETKKRQQQALTTRTGAIPRPSPAREGGSEVLPPQADGHRVGGEGGGGGGVGRAVNDLLTWNKNMNLNLNSTNMIGFTYS